MDIGILEVEKTGKTFTFCRAKYVINTWYSTLLDVIIKMYLSNKNWHGFILGY